jgi:hypothetical protein
MNILHESNLIYLTDHEKGLIAENIASTFFIAHGYDVSKPLNGSGPYDLIVVNSEKKTAQFVQVKCISKTKNSIKTCSSGSSKQKGGKRKRIDYAKYGVDWLVGVDLETFNVYAYPLEFYKNKPSINVLKNPSHTIELVKNRGYRTYEINYNDVSLDMVC